MSMKQEMLEGTKSISEARINRISERYGMVGQGHVLKYLSEISDDEKAALLTQLEVIPVEKLDGFLKAAMEGQSSITSSNDITPFSKQVGRTTDKESTEAASTLGMESIGRGEVAALVLAGGQGTRLGFSGPKGMYNIGLPSERTLFQMISERIMKLRMLAAGNSDSLAPIPFFIMTSPINHEETVRFFEEKSYFGLPRDDVFFFEQGMLPCLTDDGKIIMETESKVAMAPDGNGGVYTSLHNSGMLAEMDKRSIKHLHIFSIDNALTKPADPVFIGHCISQGADCGNKVVWKAGASEKVGVIAERHGKPCVVEYSDITEEMAERVDSNGRLVFGAGNICNHYYALNFLKDVVLPRLGNMYHIARKKIPTYDEESKTTVVPVTDNGIKLESFIFDVFPFSVRMAVLDVLREDEFAPVKNAPGSSSDSPDTARAYISRLAKKWVVDAGGLLKDDLEDAISEVAPLSSYGGEGLEHVKGCEIQCPFLL
jgi:UDP-N-acetylglucosamine/UDP-N-acetylgalactosamine diphosphorylase